jgi:nitrite reductase/ring-hydroxylating ferredoxin subunit
MERGWHRVGTRAEIESGVVKRVQIGVRWIGLHVWNGRIYAIDDVCPHWGVPLTDGVLLPDGRIECALHGWTYDLCTGRGCEGYMGSLDRFDVEEHDGVVYVSTTPSDGSAGGCTNLSGSGL